MLSSCMKHKVKQEVGDQDGEDYEGSYSCMFCFRSVRGEPALRCSQCTCNPFHQACVANTKFQRKCPQCQREDSVVAFEGKFTTRHTGHVEAVDLMAAGDEANEARLKAYSSDKVALESSCATGRDAADNGEVENRSLQPRCIAEASGRSLRRGFQRLCDAGGSVDPGSLMSASVFCRPSADKKKARSTSDTISPSMEKPKIGKAARVEENAGSKKRKRAAAEESGRTNKAHKNKRLTQDDSSKPVKRRLCEHQRRRSTCKECGGASICEHQRQRNKCKECGGAGICEHQRERSRCKECGGASLCQHQRRRSRCTDCRGAAQV